MPQRAHTILCIVGTRPEAIKMAPVINRLRFEPWARVRVAETGQHPEMTRAMLDLFGIGRDIVLDTFRPGQSLAALSSRLIDALDRVIDETMPDLVLVQGDTTSAMVGALTAFYRRLPVAHVEAGLRTSRIDRPFPEELNRRIAGLVGSLHFAPTARARDALVAEGVDPGSVFVTGNPVIDALLDIAAREPACPLSIDPERRVVLVTAHRRESHGSPIAEICAGVADLLARFPDVEAVWPVHPNPAVRAPIRAALAGNDRVRLVDPLDYAGLVALMRRSSLVLTDSGGLQEEAPALGKHVLVLREETERMEAVEAGVATLVGASRRRIVEEASRRLRDGAPVAAAGLSPFGDGLAAHRIAQHAQAFLTRRSGAAEPPALTRVAAR